MTLHRALMLYLLTSAGNRLGLRRGAWDPEAMICVTDRGGRKAYWEYWRCHASVMSWPWCPTFEDTVARDWDVVLVPGIDAVVVTAGPGAGAAEGDSAVAAGGGEGGGSVGVATVEVWTPHEIPGGGTVSLSRELVWPYPEQQRDGEQAHVGSVREVSL